VHVNCRLEQGNIETITLPSELYQQHCCESERGHHKGEEQGTHMLRRAFIQQESGCCSHRRAARLCAIHTHTVHWLPLPFSCCWVITLFRASCFCCAKPFFLLNFWVSTMLYHFPCCFNINIICIIFRMKRKYYSWDEAMNLREVKVRNLFKIYFGFSNVYICCRSYLIVLYLFVTDISLTVCSVMYVAVTEEIKPCKCCEVEGGH
jgi:hypothetical protein